MYASLGLKDCATWWGTGTALKALTETQRRMGFPNRSDHLDQAGGTIPRWWGGKEDAFPDFEVLYRTIRFDASSPCWTVRERPRGTRPGSPQDWFRLLPVESRDCHRQAVSHGLGAGVLLPCSKVPVRQHGECDVDV
jgi:hypothetical protein